MSGEVGARGERRWGGWAVREGMLGAAGRAMAGFYRRIPTSLATEQCLRTGKGLAPPPSPPLAPYRRMRPSCRPRHGDMGLRCLGAGMRSSGVRSCPASARLQQCAACAFPLLFRELRVCRSGGGGGIVLSLMRGLTFGVLSCVCDIASLCLCSFPSCECVAWCVSSPRCCTRTVSSTMKRAGKVVAPLVRRAQRLAAVPKRFAGGSAVVNPSEADLYQGGLLTGFRKAYCGPLPPSYSVDPALMKLPPTKVTTLSNGMRVATETTPGESVAVGVFIKSGSRYETDESNGSAHFLEHMFFKGSKNTTQGMLEKKVEQMGCRLNAYTSREQTVYYANVLKKDVGESLGILSEMLLQSTFEPAAIEREKRTILQEMEEVRCFVVQRCCCCVLS